MPALPFFTILFLLSAGIYSQTDLTQNTVCDTCTDPISASLVFSGNDTETEDQDPGPLLASDRDVFWGFAGFTFSQGLYRPRALQAKHQQLLINYLPIGDPGAGTFNQNYRSGLNDVMRFPDAGTGIVGNSLGFSGALGYASYDTRAHTFSKGSRFSLAGSNHLFATRWTLSHFTGSLPSGWAFAVSASGRNGPQYQPGTFINAQSLFLSASRNIRDKYIYNLSFLSSYVQRGAPAMQVKETADLTGNNYYNSSWGFQAGRARNAVVRTGNRPLLIADQELKLYEGLNITNSLGFSWGGASNTGLNWYDSDNPRPDYYRKLPSWFADNLDDAGEEQSGNAWQKDLNTQQIQWDEMIHLNRANLYSLPSETGVPNFTETRARYLLEKRVEKATTLTLASSLRKRVRQIALSGGFSLVGHRTRKYKEAEDLLGSDFWLDYDQFTSNTLSGQEKQNNIDAPDKKIRKGDLFGYDYTLFTNRAAIWTQADYSGSRFNCFAAVELGHQQTWRYSQMANGKFPESSRGRSATSAFNNLGIRSGATGHLSNRTYLSAGFCFTSLPPDTRHLFIAQEVRNDLVNDLRPEKTLAAELSCIYRGATRRIRFTTWLTEQRDLTRVNSYLLEEVNTLVNYALTGLNQRSYGLEIGAEQTIFGAHSLQFAAGISDSRFSNRPMAQAWQNTTGTALFTNRMIYLRNHSLGGSPQTVIGCSWRFTPSVSWQLSLTAAWFDKIYVSPNPEKRSAEAHQQFTDEDREKLERIISPERLPGYMTTSARVAKSFRFRHFRMYLHLSLNNPLNTKNIRVQGAEQLRYDPQYPDRFANRYNWLPGFTWLAGLTISF